MKTRRIAVPGEKTYYNVYELDAFEYVNPIDQISKVVMDVNIELERNILKSKGYIFPIPEVEDTLQKRAIKDWESFYQEMMSINLHVNLFKLLETTSKKEQIKTLKGLSLTEDELIAFTLRMGKDYGFTYSSYSATYYHEGLDKSELPVFALKDKQNNITSVGKTTLTEGKLRQTIDQRKVTNVKFFDKGEIWHCFFHTYKSLKGEETYKEGQPHLHYISNYWGLRREDIKTRLLSKEGFTSSVHIDFHTHRNPKK